MNSISFPTCSSDAKDENNSKNSKTSIVFAEYEIVSEMEPEKEIKEFDSLASLLNQQEISTQETQQDKEDQDIYINETETQVDVDDAFLKFQKRVNREPEQILRYARVSNDETFEPLWASDSSPPCITPCSHCGGPRTFEFQIMPQILNLLNLNHLDENVLDFGTLIVYSCFNSCQPKELDYIEECIWKQDFSSHGLGPSQNTKTTF